MSIFPIRPSHSKSGLTFLDILAATLLLGLTVSIAVPAYNTAVTRRGGARARSDLREMSRAIEIYAMENGAYPPSVTTADATRIPQAVYGASEGYLPPLTSHRQALTRLTTPVAYLSAVNFNAPFLARAWEITEAEGRARAPSYWYMNYGDFFRTCRGCVAPLPLKGYALLAFGPRSLGIGGVSAAYADQYPLQTRVPCFDRPNLENMYDPTNGTMSRGNILRFGGSFPLEDGVRYIPYR